jgi:hypothetical protein
MENSAARRPLQRVTPYGTVKLSSGFVAVGKRKGAVKRTIHDDDFPKACLSIWLGAIRRMWACRLGGSVVTVDEHDHCNSEVLKPGT